VIVASLENTTREWRTRVRGVVTYYDARGRKVGDGLAFPGRVFVPPGVTFSMRYFDVRPPASFRRYTLTFTSERATARPADKVRAAIGNVALDTEFSHLEVPVTVTNGNSGRVENVAVHVTLFTKTGQIVNFFDGYNYTRPSALAPGRKGKITITFGSRYEGTGRINVQAEAKAAGR